MKMKLMLALGLTIAGCAISTAYAVSMAQCANKKYFTCCNTDDDTPIWMGYVPSTYFIPDKFCEGAISGGGGSSRCAENAPGDNCTYISSSKNHSGNMNTK